MNYENILFQIQDGVGILTFNRPKVMNALNSSTLDEIADVVRQAAVEDALRVLVITGAGDRAFVAGADINEFVPLNVLGARHLSEKGQRICLEIEQLPKPVIACVNGFALGGGCEIAMACDFIYASDKARFGQPEVNLGIMPGFGGTQRLSRLIGRAEGKRNLHDRRSYRCAGGKSLWTRSKDFPAGPTFR